MAVSDRLPNILLVGGAGVRAGVPRHLEHLSDSLRDVARVTIASDVDEGGFDRLGAAHVTVPGLATRLSPEHLFRGAAGLFQLLRNCPADLIWFHARLPVLMGRLLLVTRLWRPSASVACTFHGLPFDPGHKPAARRLSLALEKLLLAYSPPMHLVFLTNQMKDRMMSAVGAARLARHWVHVLENCSDLGNLPQPAASNGRHLVVTGRVGWQKNLDLAARLLAHLPPDFTLSLCGPGTDAPAFCDHIAALVPSDVFTRIRFVGPVRDVRAALMAADAYLLTSRYEGTPIGALEATEAGLPIILADFEGARDMTNLHPHALNLRFRNLGDDADRIVSLLDRVSAGGAGARRDIRAIWAAHWSPTQFTPAARAIVAQTLRPSDLAAE